MDISDVRKNLIVKRNIRWDVTPEVLFKPRFTMGMERDIFKETEGFMFYIELVKGSPRLMLMRTIQLMSSTVGEIEGIPVGILSRAVEADAAKTVAGMYPIGGELEGWLRVELGLDPPASTPRP